MAPKIKNLKKPDRKKLYKPQILEQKNSRHRHTRGRYSKKSLQKHIEGSETDHINRGLQNQYQRWGYDPEMLYGWPFHTKTIEISSTISIFEAADFSTFRNRVF